MKPLRVVSLYPRDMNIYGDRGNVLALMRRAEQYGLSVEVIEVNPGDAWPESVDIVIGGGGQDSGQVRVAADLVERGEMLRGLANDGVPMLLICGLYQLFGHRFITSTGQTLSGIGVLDVETRGGDTRMIGNTIIMSDEFGEVIGFENHSGHTVLGPASTPFGRVVQGAGNNPHDGVEGARSNRVIGTYLHGSLLPKNPAVTDYLIAGALERRGLPVPDPAPQSIAVHEARRSAQSRPR